MRKLVETVDDGQDGIAGQRAGIGAKSRLTVGDQYLGLAVLSSVEQKLSWPRSVRSGLPRQCEVGGPDCPQG